MCVCMCDLSCNEKVPWRDLILEVASVKGEYF